MVCFYHWVCNCSYGVVSVSTIGFVTVLTVWSVSTIGFVTVLTVWSLFLPLGLLLFLRCGLCFYHYVYDCSYGVVSVSTIEFVTVLTVWSLFL